MRHVVVRRVAVVFGGLLIVLATAFAWLVRDDTTTASPAAGQATQGQALYRRYCARCHAVEDLGRRLREGGAARRAEWETFLLDHGRSSPEEDRMILDYLSMRAWE